MARFLERLEQGIGRRFGHRLGRLQHHQGAAPLHRAAGQKPGHLPHLLQAQLGGTAATEAQGLSLGGLHQPALVQVRGLDPEQVGVVTLRQAPPQRHRSGASTGEHPLQQAQGRQAAAHPLGPHEQVGRRQPPAFEGGREQPHRLRLADQIGEQLSHAPPDPLGRPGAG